MQNLTNSAACGNVTWEKILTLIKEQDNSDRAGDATWILTSAFIIFTMQSGFGLLEAGTVSSKNETNIMVKNAVDVVFGALGYWACGFGFSFGDDEKYANAFTGFGYFFTDTDQNDEDGGNLFARYLFQLSFATTATTIVSGAMAERTNLKAYMFFSFINFFSYVFPAHWIWAEKGFLFKKGVVDVAGCGPVHVVGGVSAMVASVILKPRIGVFENGKKIPRPMGSATNVVLGTFMLWWGWLGFNCGSTFGVSGGKWKLATRAAVTTVNASTGAGLWGLFYCYVVTKKYDKKLDVGIFTSSIIGGLVSITAICAICNPWEALLIGMIGGVITVYGISLMDWLQIDDPVSATPVHCFCGIWGMVCVGLFGEKDTMENISMYRGVFKGGPWYYLGYQMLAALTIVAWAVATSAIELLLSNFLFGLRVSKEEEELGADYCEHGIPLLESQVDKLNIEEQIQCWRDIAARLKEDDDSLGTNGIKVSQCFEKMMHRKHPFEPRQVDNPVFYQCEDVRKTLQYGYTSFGESSYNTSAASGNDNFGFQLTVPKPIYTIEEFSRRHSAARLSDTPPSTTENKASDSNDHTVSIAKKKYVFRKTHRPTRLKTCILC